MSTELVIIEKLNLDLVPFFTKGDRLDELLDAIKVDIMAHVPDVSTPKGRTLIKNNITAGKKYRLHLEESGKKLSAEYKLIPSAIDATRKKANEFLLRVEAKARERLTEWELIDKAEKKQIADTAAYLIKFDYDLVEGHRDNELIDLKAKQAAADRQAEITKAADEAKVKAEDKAAAEIKQAKLDKETAEADADKAKQATKDAEWLTYISEAYTHNDKLIADNNRIIAKQAAEWLAYLNEAYAHNDQLIAAKSARDAVLRSQREEDERISREETRLKADKLHTKGVKIKAFNDFRAFGLDIANARLAVQALAAGKIAGQELKY